MGHACTVIGCPCTCFTEKTKMTTLLGLKSKNPVCATCKHKKTLHKAHESAALLDHVDVPTYWDNKNGDFNTLIELKQDSVRDFQALLSRTYLNKWTRDRK